LKKHSKLKKNGCYLNHINTTMEKITNLLKWIPKNLNGKKEKQVYNVLILIKSLLCPSHHYYIPMIQCNTWKQIHSGGITMTTSTNMQMPSTKSTMSTWMYMKIRG
jgi:hypothetical protein